MDVRTYWTLVLVGSLSLSLVLVSSVSYSFLSSEQRLVSALDESVEHEAFLTLVAEDAGSIISTFVMMSGANELASRLRDVLSDSWVKQQGHIVVSSFLDSIAGRGDLSAQVSIAPLRHTLAAYLATSYPLPATYFEQLIPETLPVSLFLNGSAVDSIRIRYTALSYMRWMGMAILGTVGFMGYKRKEELPISRAFTHGGALSCIGSFIGMMAIASYIRSTADALGHASISAYADTLASHYVGHVWLFMLLPLGVSVVGLAYHARRRSDVMA